MDRDRLIQRLMATFLEELEEHVAALNRDLLALEKGPAKEERAERLRTLFRTVHSLKGAARSVNVDLIEGACHRLEEILTRVRDLLNRFPGVTTRLHWSFPDPSKFTGNLEQKMNETRRVRDKIDTQIRRFCAEHSSK